ncbi:class I SAM-dependent methyltransferase [Nitrosospira multiformis]|uniref:Methyltransferase domain-containing protein n=1 Tax=Nitrosospira multiformis TaxID=1231 RepID=A0A1I7GD54_9PROT|nr:class I SAM-dependent methyltransferase [Nitrosospira multiformis]SFU46387.1 Methyltransferase domain-containing protein [Nitrosospira multiformis]
MLAYLTLLLLIAVLAVGLYALHKIRRVHIMLYEIPARSSQDMNDLFLQIEALHGLYIDLGLQKSLPPTRGWAASPDFLQELVRHMLEEKPQVIVECSSGVSTVVLARCAQLNGTGKVYSLEHEPEFAQKTRMNLARLGLAEYATVIDAPLMSYTLNDEVWPWYDIQALPQGCKVDLLVIDGPPYFTRSLARYPAGPILFSSLAESAVIFLDDAARDDEKKILEIWGREFPELSQAASACEKGCVILKKTLSRAV